jgi:prepilin-type N-terminal cleavage/methylation domain-containing protein
MRADTRSSHAADGVPRRRRRGFTLIEVMMSIVVLSVGVVAAARMFSFGRLLSSSEEDRIDALMKCERALERVLASDPATVRPVPALPVDADGATVRILVTDVGPRLKKVVVEYRYAPRRGVTACERLATLVGDLE